MNNNVEWEVLPLFSKPLAISTIDDSISKQLKEICSQISWVSDDEETGTKGGWSESRNILDDYKEIKDYFSAFSSTCIKDIYKYFVDFQVTTSWFTITLPGGYARDHIHCNSWFSAVVYFDDYEEASNKLVLNQDPGNILISNKEENIFNGHSLTISPKSNMIVLFPSQVRHHTTKNKSDKNRYCFAFNIMPVGLIGNGDSLFKY